MLEGLYDKGFQAGVNKAIDTLADGDERKKRDMEEIMFAHVLGGGLTNVN